MLVRDPEADVNGKPTWLELAHEINGATRREATRIAEESVKESIDPGMKMQVRLVPASSWQGVELELEQHPSLKRTELD